MSCVILFDVSERRPWISEHREAKTGPRKMLVGLQLLKEEGGGFPGKNLDRCACKFANS